MSLNCLVFNQQGSLPQGTNMGCDIGPITDEAADKRFQESLKIRDQLDCLTTTHFTFGELRFLLEFYKFRHSHSVSEKQLKELQRLLLKAQHPYY